LYHTKGGYTFHLKNISLGDLPFNFLVGGWGFATGRDRTGALIAILLLLAGAGPDAVVRDYLCSHQGTTTSHEVSALVQRIIGYSAVDNAFLLMFGIT
jgi:hypothetical protein